MDAKLLVQEYLKSHTFGELEAEFGVGISVAKARPYKFSVNYDQIESKPSPLVNQCRGLVLAVESKAALPFEDKVKLAQTCPGLTRILARPFDRFFNHGDPNCAELNWDDPELEVQEKLDGTLAIVYYDDFVKEWCMATRSVSDADLPFESLVGSMTYRQLFDKALKNTVGDIDLPKFMDGVDKDLTFCFELTSPWNRIVVNYSQESLTYLGCRERSTGRELYHSQALATFCLQVQFSFPKQAVKFPIKTLEQITQLNDSTPPDQGEGVVVMDSNFRRVKIKSVAYLAASRIKSAAGSTRGLMELILLGREDDIVSLVPPQVIARVTHLKAQYASMGARIEKAQSEFLVASEGIQKAYALKVIGSGLWSAPLFEMKSKKITFKLWVDSKKDTDGSWNNSFLDNLLAAIGKFSQVNDDAQISEISS